MSEYQAGVCNIGPQEIKKRRRVALLGFGASLLVFLLSDYLASTGSQFLFFITTLMGSIGYVQSRRKFCLAFGLAGTFNVSESMKKVVSPEDLRADRKTALTILGQSFLLACAITALFISLPL